MIDKDEFNVQLIMESEMKTVVTNFIPQPKKNTGYQSEEALEKDFIKKLQNVGYEYLDIHHVDELKDNLRKQLGKLNDRTFSDTEWQRFYHSIIANPSHGFLEKTKMIQKDRIVSMEMDNGEQKNIKLLDIVNVNNNTLQVINRFILEISPAYGKIKSLISHRIIPVIHIITFQ